MPRRNGTGPQGQGAGTGRGLGNCGVPKGSSSQRRQGGEISGNRKTGRGSGGGRERGNR
ncbi:DUF5320 domain-containing protein [Desulfogranum marinum]|uniref:DUF5320 domain-containing protein n=1 Tax=Desulfogranum marinum TaxID=453220 RepID=UPI0029C991BB|nr:DUF5320 domain-containing protein [Desulfogranum marinum]